MKKAFSAIKETYQTASSRTPEYLACHRTFKREFTKFLQGKSASSIQINKPNHFDLSGYFVIAGQTWYFRIEDLRWSKDNMLIRTAKDSRDFIGGANQFIPLSEKLEDFEQGFVSTIAAGNQS